MFFGSHVSIRNGYLGAAQEALRIGGKAFQYFPKNPRSLSLKTHDRRDAKRCSRFCHEHELLSIAHAPYASNLSTEMKEKRELTIQSLLNDLEIADDCGSIGVVVHFGTYKGQDPLEGYKLMVYTLDTILSQWKGKALLLIENNAGKGGKMGTTLEELVQIRRLTSHPDKIGFCLDTCHAFASGLWTGYNWEEVLEKGTQLDFFSHLKAIHLNDSKFPSGSRHDRHAPIGRGYIGSTQIVQLLTSDPLFKRLPVILETPTSQSYSHQEELTFLRQMMDH